MADADTDRAWSRWGEIDPYFAVVTDPGFRKHCIEQNRAAFMQSGEDYVARHFGEIEQTLGPVALGRALDFGCGVGRITLPLARRFDEVVGLDISDGMLREAKANGRSQGLDDVIFARSDDALSAATGQFDFVHTYIVLQHIPVARGMRIIDRLLERTAVGGVASLHFTIRRTMSLAQGLTYWSRHNVPGVSWLSNVARGRPGGEPVMQMNEYSLEAVLGRYFQHGFGKVLVGFEQHGLFRSAQVVARKRDRTGQAKPSRHSHSQAAPDAASLAEPPCSR